MPQTDRIVRLTVHHLNEVKLLNIINTYGTILSIIHEVIETQGLMARIYLQTSNWDDLKPLLSDNAEIGWLQISEG